MAAGKRDILIQQSSGFDEIWRFQPGGVPADLTGFDFKGEIRKFGSTTVLGTFIFTLLDQTNPATKGMVRITMTAVNARAIPVNYGLDCEDRITDYPYDMLLIPPVGEPDRFAEGCALVSAGATEL